MKRAKNKIFAVSVILILLGCTSTDPNESSNHDFEIHLQAWFSNTPVEVFLDDSLFLRDSISTESSIAIARIIPTNLVEGTHELRVIANGEAEYMETFEIKSTLYVGVIYESTQSKISFHFQTDKFYYD
jgi:hypothetical protein